MSIEVLIGRDAVPIDDTVFTTLLDSSVAGTYRGYERALESGRIKYAELVELARKGEIPHSLELLGLRLHLPLHQRQRREEQGEGNLALLRALDSGRIKDADLGPMARQGESAH